jgi:hypothetical protein
MPVRATGGTLAGMVSISIPVGHARRRGSARIIPVLGGSSHGRSPEAVAWTEAVALALGTHALRRMLPWVRIVVAPPRAVLDWRLQRLAWQRAVERRERERRRRIAAAAAVATFGATLAVGARFAARR